MARSEEGEYSTYSTDEQRRQRAKDQARWLQNVAVEALGRLLVSLSLAYLLGPFAAGLSAAQAGKIRGILD